MINVIKGDHIKVTDERHLQNYKIEEAARGKIKIFKKMLKIYFFNRKEEFF